MIDVTSAVALSIDSMLEILILLLSNIRGKCIDCFHLRTNDRDGLHFDGIIVGGFGFNRRAALILIYFLLHQKL